MTDSILAGVLIIALITWGFSHEDDFIAFEDRIFNKIRRNNRRMRLHVHTKITSNTGKCYDIIDAAVDFIHDQQMYHLEPIGLITSSKPEAHNLPKWFSHMYIDKHLGRMMQRHQNPADPKTPPQLLKIFEYMTILGEYNAQITGDCCIETSWIVG